MIKPSLATTLLCTQIYHPYVQCRSLLKYKSGSCRHRVLRNNGCFGDIYAPTHYDSRRVMCRL